MSSGYAVKWGVVITSHGAYKSPRGLCRFLLHLVFENGACEGTRGSYLAANEPSHVATRTFTRWAMAMEVGVLIALGLDPRNKPTRSVCLMASTTLAGVAMVELCLPGVSRYLEESSVKEYLRP